MNLTTENTKALHKEHGGVHVNELATTIIGVAIQVHTALGPGLLESCYKECLYYKLNQAGLFVEKEKPMPIVFEEVNWNVVIELIC